MKGDKIYCFTCGHISYDNMEYPTLMCSHTKKSIARQDSRINPNWNYRCPYCHGFKTINASQFLDSGKSDNYVKLLIGPNPLSLRACGRQLKEKGIIKNFMIKKNKNNYVLYERRRIKKLLLKALKLTTNEKI